MSIVSRAKPPVSQSARERVSFCHKNAAPLSEEQSRQAPATFDLDSMVAVVLMHSQRLQLFSICDHSYHCHTCSCWRQAGKDMIISCPDKGAQHSPAATASTGKGSGRGRGRVRGRGRSSSSQAAEAATSNHIGSRRHCTLL